MTDIVEYMKKKEANKQSNKTRASLRDFVVLNNNRNFYASVVSSAELPESREFKSSLRATIFVQNLKTMRVLQFSSSVIPKLITV